MDNYNNVSFNKTDISYPTDFNFKKQCANCYEKLATFDKIKIADNMCVCRKCLSQCSKELLHNTDKKNIADIKNSIYRMNLYPEFAVTHQYGKLMFDTKNKLWKQEGYPVFKFKDILDFEVVEERNSTSITTTREKTQTKGGKGSALVGGLLFGNVGAVVGGVTGNRKHVTIGSSNTSTYDVFVNLGIRIAINDLDNPSMFISFINQPISVSASSYIVEELNKAVSFLNIILKNKEQNSTNESEKLDTLNKSEKADSIVAPYTYNGNSNNKTNTEQATKQKRKSIMKIFSIICFIYVAICAIMAISDLTILPMTLFFAVLGVMFLMLHLTPKESKYILDKQPINKKAFVILCVILAFTITGILVNVLG